MQRATMESLKQGKNMILSTPAGLYNKYREDGSIESLYEVTWKRVPRAGWGADLSSTCFVESEKKCCMRNGPGD